LLASVLGPACLLAWALWVEPQRLVVNRAELELPRWPKPLEGLRVALVSDLHVGSPFWDLRALSRLVERTNAENPDLILLAGDYQINGVRGGVFVAPEPIAERLAVLKAPLGVFAILGNHDWWNDGERMRTAFEQAGIVVLENQARLVPRAGAPFYVVGLADTMTRPQAIDETIRQVPSGEPFLVLVHEPDVFPQIDGRAALTLAGHTHGGQVNLPFLGRRVVPSQYGQRFAAGHVVEQGRHLFVTTGVGTSIYPVRFRVPPEIALLTLQGE
jgi:predicted MPP superfamily phosphohydrolase